MRLTMCMTMRTLWTHLDDRQYHFIPAIIAPFLEISLIPNRELRALTIPLLVGVLRGDHLRSATVQLVRFYRYSISIIFHNRLKVNCSID